MPITIMHSVFHINFFAINSIFHCKLNPLLLAAVRLFYFCMIFLLFISLHGCECILNELNISIYIEYTNINVHYRERSQIYKVRVQYTYICMYLYMLEMLELFNSLHKLFSTYMYLYIQKIEKEMRFIVYLAVDIMTVAIHFTLLFFVLSFLNEHFKNAFIHIFLHLCFPVWHFVYCRTSFWEIAYT